MRRLEIIQVRHSGTVPNELLREIRRSAEALAHLVEYRLYRHAAWTTDLGVHLYFDADAEDPSMSEFGTRIADALKEHGMVEHTVWLEDPADNATATPEHGGRTSHEG